MKRAPSRRHLRLKEWQPLIDCHLCPSPEYLEGTDGSLRNIEYRVRTDSDGYILPPPSNSVEPTESIIFFGDSFVESVYVPEDQRFVAAIQKALYNNEIKVHCLNAGYSGSTTLHMLMTLIGKVGPRPATTIVLVLPSNDALALTKKGGLWCRSDKRYTPLIPAQEGTDIQSQPFNITDIKVTLNLFIDACRRMHLNLIFATFPHRTAAYSNDPWLSQRFKTATTYARMHKWRQSINAIGRSIAHRLQIPCIDLEALVSTHTEYFYDDLHMNETGSEVIARIFSDFFISQRQATKS